MRALQKKNVHSDGEKMNIAIINNRVDGWRQTNFKACYEMWLFGIKSRSRVSYLTPGLVMFCKRLSKDQDFRHGIQDVVCGQWPLAESVQKRGVPVRVCGRLP